MEAAPVKLSFVSHFALSCAGGRGRGRGRRRKRRREKRKGGRKKKEREGREKEERERKREEGKKKGREGKKKGGSYDLPTGRPAAAARQHAIGTRRQHMFQGGRPLRGRRTLAAALCPMAKKARRLKLGFVSGPLRAKAKEEKHRRKFRSICLYFSDDFSKNRFSKFP